MEQIQILNSSINTLLLALEQALGQDQFNALFGLGNDLENFIPTGQIEINGVSVDESSLNYLLNQINSNAYQDTVYSCRMRSFYNIIFFIIFISLIHGNKIAVTTKVKGLVEIMPIGKDDFSNLKLRNNFIRWR